jgi:hypothetical protein
MIDALPFARLALTVAATIAPLCTVSAQTTGGATQAALAYGRRLDSPMIRSAVVATDERRASVRLQTRIDTRIQSRIQRFADRQETTWAYRATPSDRVREGRTTALPGSAAPVQSGPINPPVQQQADDPR